MHRKNGGARVSPLCVLAKMAAIARSKESVSCFDACSNLIPYPCLPWIIDPEPIRVAAYKVPAAVRDKHAKYVRTVRNIRRRFHGTSCSDACNFIIDPQVKTLYLIFA